MRVYEWSQTATVGQCIVYHRGRPGMMMSAEVQGSAFEASRRGFVFLAQRRRADGGFNYEATRISRMTALRLGLVESNRFGLAA